MDVSPYFICPDLGISWIFNSIRFSLIMRRLRAFSLHRILKAVASVSDYQMLMCPVLRILQGVMVLLVRIVEMLSSSVMLLVWSVVHLLLVILVHSQSCCCCCCRILLNRTRLLLLLL